MAITMDRRAFLKTSLVTGAVLASGASLYGCSDLDILDSELVNDEVSLALAALIPVLFDGALPEDEQARTERIVETIAGVKRALQKLPPHLLDELNDLFGLLTSRLANLIYAGSFAQLQDVSFEQRNALLNGWAQSYIGLLNTAYEGLKELVFAAFYGNPANWHVMQYQKPNLGI